MRGQGAKPQHEEDLAIPRTGSNGTTLLLQQLVLTLPQPLNYNTVEALKFHIL